MVDNGMTLTTAKWPAIKWWVKCLWENDMKKYKYIVTHPGLIRGSTVIVLL